MHADVMFNVKCCRPGRDLNPPIFLILLFDFTPESGMNLSHTATTKMMNHTCSDFFTWLLQQSLTGRHCHFLSLFQWRTAR